MIEADRLAEYYTYDDINQSILRLMREARSFDRNSRAVLDLGCGRARLGMELENLGYIVTGVEKHPLAASVARGRISEVFELDMTDYHGAAEILDGRRFDWVLGAASIEHCSDPWSVLRFYRQFLGPRGRLLISLPNVAVWYNRIRMILGSFEYVSSGVMDRTHLRFFTYSSAQRLVTDSGYALEKCVTEPGIARAFLPVIRRLIFQSSTSPDAILNSRSYRAYRRYVVPVESIFAWLAPGLFAFETVILARPTSS